ncbi:uncharacterized protein LOC107269931 [Cephus cinctus]|uniref:Uncharacterized protein LOC107269931 n=1 Tax=Cephus cinctus TaxID=211228 RepID=A0AAJ7FN06_CEPCN|nr:uncharacterized protein LOC107269931 [Cephus cinctus]
MDNIYAKLNDWIKLVQSHQLKGIASDVKKTITVDLNDARLNKTVFKLLLHLSRTADQFDKSKIETIKEIGKLTTTICSLLVSVPNEHNFFSSIYHILRCLLTAQLYTDAMEICDWLTPGRLLKDTQKSSDIYTTISHLWQKAVERQLHEAFNNLNDQTWELLTTLITYECDMLQIAYGQQWKRVLSKIDFYFEKIMGVIKLSKGSYYNHFRDAMISYLMSLRISFEGNHKLENYRYVLLLINRIILEQITSSEIEYVGDTFKKLCKVFESAMKKDKECCKCFEFYKEICIIYLRPVMSLSNCEPDSIRQVVQRYKNVVTGLRFDGAVKWNSYMLARILTLLFTYWEQSLKNESWQNINAELLTETLIFVQFTGSMLSLQLKDTCKACNVEECKLKQDNYNAVVLKLRFLSVLYAVSDKNLLKDIYSIIQALLEEIIASIFEMKLSECKQWTQMWSICGSHIYNLCITYKDYYEESTFLSSLLCSSIIQFEGINSSVTYIHLDKTLSTALHRLCSIHYNHEKYREAMTAAALNGLISYNNSETKAFRMWANVKHKCITSESIMKMTILQCLKIDRQSITEIGMDINLNDYDLRKLCLREIKALQEARVNLSVAIVAVLDELESLNPNALEYGHGVLLLGYHSLIYENPDRFYEYLKKAVSMLKKEKHTWSHISLVAGFEFYKFINHARTMSKQTQCEMDSAKFALLAPKLNSTQEPENVVPAYSTINVKEDSRLQNYLQQPLKTWALYIENIDTLESFVPWEFEYTLQTIVIAGEYCRLHRFLDCEINAWKLAYNLATKQKNHRVIIYVVGRAILSRYINKEWIDTATKLSIDLKHSTDNNVIDAIVTYWIGLSDFYFEIGKHEEASKLFDEATILQESSILCNQSTYLMRLDILLRNPKLSIRSNETYNFSLYIVQSLYAMISLSSNLIETKSESKERILYGYDVLLSSTNRLSLRLNSLLSFKEISAHLIQRLKISQKLGATLRVAECLKNLCFIDLSRMQLDDCEVKLQGLEHILDIESIELSMKSKLQTVETSSYSVSSSERMVESVRDIAQNPASPVLRRKVFAPSDFLLHKDCTCYKCRNVPYQYLVFASTYIRAQLYALQHMTSAAMEHFYGAFKIRQSIFARESQGSLDSTINKMDLERHPWEFYYNMVEYVLFLLDFSRFIKEYKLAKEEKGLNIALEAINICQTHNLENHPIYVSAKELLFEYRYQKILSTVDYSNFTVPAADSIDVSKFTHVENPKLSVCVTPTQNIRKNPIKSLRRHRTPPVLKLTKVSMNLLDDEETTASLHESKSKRNLNSVKSKLPLNDCAESSDDENSLFAHVNPVLDNPKNINSERLSLEDVIHKASSLLPEMSSRLRKLSTGQSLRETPDATKIQELIKVLEDSTIKDTARPIRKSRSRVKLENNISSKSNPLNEKNNEKVNEIIDLFKGLLLSSKSTEDTLESNIHTSLELESSNHLSVEPDIKLTPRVSGNKIRKTYCKQSVRTKLFVSNAKDTSEIASNSLKNNENHNSENVIDKSKRCKINENRDKEVLNVPIITVDEFEKVSGKKNNTKEMKDVKCTIKTQESLTSKVLLYSDKKTENVPNELRPKSGNDRKKLPKRSITSMKKVIVYSDSEDESFNRSEDIPLIDPQPINSVRTTRSRNTSTRQSKKNNFQDLEPATSVSYKELVNADEKKFPKRAIRIKEPQPSTSKTKQTKSQKKVSR